jgi:cytosine permease
MLPDYISKAVPNPASNRAPWYVNTAPSYAGIFLWIGFYQAIAGGTVGRASTGVAIAALAVAGLLSYALYYYVPGMLGMKTGYPLYVVGSSTFGTKGGYLMPGLLMGVLQVGWFAVGTYLAATYILSAFGAAAKPGSLPFILIAIVWGYTMAYVGVKGIQLVSRVSLFLNIIPFLMLLVVLYSTREGWTRHVPANPSPMLSFALLIQIVIGFFATAGAAGADFGMNNRNARDIRMGGLVGIALAALYAGALPWLSVAGARVLNPTLQATGYDAAISSIGGALASAMFLLFAVASIAPACICAFVAANSFSTMIPGVPRMSSTMAAVTISIVLAVTGAAANLIGFFSIVGASFGPICGAMIADYILSGRKWAGPREGINWAGYIAWALGFLVGILPFLPISQTLKEVSQPAAVYSTITGFAVYWLLAKAGMEPKVVEIQRSSRAA